MDADRGDGVATAGLRIVSWNVHGASAPDLRALAGVIGEFGADVVALQEVRRGQATALGELTGLPEVRWGLKHRPWGPLAPGRAEGLAVLSRFAVTAERMSGLTPEFGLNTFRRRVMYEVVVTAPLGPVHVVVMHLASDRAADRAVQAMRAGALLDVGATRSGTERTVLVGDLNAEDEAGVFEPLAAVGLRDVATAATSPSDEPRVRLDHVLTGSGLEVTDVTVPSGGSRWAALSDHLPIAVTVRLR